MRIIFHKSKKNYEAILLALDVLDKIGSNLQANLKVEYLDIERIIDFLKLFADKCHHGKEEGYLFPVLEKKSIKKEGGPIGVMLAEYMQGSELVGLMQESIANKSVQKKMFIDSATSYINLLSNHIDKENAVLFPMGDARLSESEQIEYEVQGRLVLSDFPLSEF